MRKEISERILYFKEYCSLMLKTTKERFWQMFGTMLLFALFMIIVTAGFMLLCGVLIARYLPYSYLSNIHAWQYIDPQTVLSQLMPVIPAIIGIGLIWIVVIMFFACAQNAMIYLIADSVACNIKRNFAGMLSFAFQRAFPSLGTAVLLALISIGIFIVFGIAFSIVLTAMGFSTYMMYAVDFGSLFQSGNMIVLTTVFILLGVIMLFVSVYIAIMYSMAQLARVKYKFSAVASLKYSRMLTKGKRGKIFGNLFFISIFYAILVFLLSLVSENITYVNIALIPFMTIILVNLISAFASFMLYIFTSFIFINFDSVKRENILNTFTSKVEFIKDKYFTDCVQFDENEQKNSDKAANQTDISEKIDTIQENDVNNLENMGIINQEDKQDD